MSGGGARMIARIVCGNVVASCLSLLLKGASRRRLSGLHSACC